MRVVITGGTRGLGLALAKEMDSRGHRVLIASRAAPSGWMGNIKVVRCDVGKPDEVLALAREAVAEMDGVDAWVNNAGATMPRPDDVGLGSEDDWMGCAGQVVSTNLGGVLNGTHCALRVRARHVFNVYGAGYDGRTDHASGHGVYAATKSAAAFYTRVLAGQGVRAHGIVPGLMRTDMLSETCAHLPVFNRTVLEVMSVSPESVARTAATVIDRVVEGDEGPQEIDCYGPNIARKAWRYILKATGSAALSNKRP